MSEWRNLFQFFVSSHHLAVVLLISKCLGSEKDEEYQCPFTGKKTEDKEPAQNKLFDAHNLDKDVEEADEAESW